jgi:pimeloyl-ACP methyl ester carboxylesterase
MDAEAAEQVAAHIDETMKECILALYRSAVNVGAEWQAGVEAVAGRFPALVLWGRDDAYVSPEFGERAAARVHGRLLMFDDSGHSWAGDQTGRDGRRPGGAVAVRLTPPSRDS